MYKNAVRAVPRRVVPSQAFYRSSKRCISSAPPAQKSRSWKSSGARWAIAAGGIYYYNTSNVFAEEPDAAIDRLEDSVHAIKESNLPTVDAIVAEKRARQAQNIAEEQKREREATAALEGDQQLDDEEGEGGIEGLEQEAGQQGAFNEETGEINWDCPCLGGMAHGPCGEEFKEAFSCFVYSKEEPKGIECIDKFKGMQDCFRQHPEMYASELADDEEDEDLQEEIRARDTSDSGDKDQLDNASKAQAAPNPQSSKPNPPTPSESAKPTESHVSPTETTAAGVTEEAMKEHGDSVPKSAHDATP